MKTTEELNLIIHELLESIRLTQEYIQLPCLPGWSWWDAYSKYRPEDALRLFDEQRSVKVDFDLPPYEVEEDEIPSPYPSKVDPAPDDLLEITDAQIYFNSNYNPLQTVIRKVVQDQHGRVLWLVIDYGSDKGLIPWSSIAVIIPKKS